MRLLPITRLLAGCALLALALQPCVASAADAFYLLTVKNPETLKQRIPLFDRELYRQALLIAARDGVGLQTRDESLREWSTQPGAAAAWKLQQYPAKIEISAGGAVAPIWSGKRLPTGHPGEIANRVNQVEALSRGDFVGLLQKNGFTGKGNATKPGAAAPADAEALLGELDELSLFHVLRETHDAIRKDGESEARLGVLVRGYANLGQLTRFHWSVEREVFTARSFLYAARMVNANPKSATALWHRAYAMALAGYQAQTLKDLTAASQLNDKTKPPGWVQLLEPFSRYNVGKLTDLAAANSDQTSLGMYLAFLAVETSGSNVAMLTTSKVTLDKNPHCLRVIDAMCANTGPGLLNALVDLGPQTFAGTLSEKLGPMPGLPPTVTQQIAAIHAGKNPGSIETLWQSLIDQGTPEKDSTELSLAALGRDIQETVFAQVQRKANLIAMQWGQDASDYAASVKPMVLDHRFKGVIEAYGAWHEPSAARKIAALKSVAWEDLSLSELPAQHMEEYAPSRGSDSAFHMMTAIYLNMSTSSFDSEAYMALYKGQLQGKFLESLENELRAASPESPWIICSDIVNHWDAGEAKEWEKAHGGYPSIQLALAKKYTELKQWDDATRCMDNYLRVSPDYDGYQVLANVYWNQGHEDQWLSTLKTFLEKTQPIALDHAMVQTQIADYYMKHHQYKEAVAYADTSAGSGAEWALQCAARAHTGLGEYDKAEALIIEAAEHYNASPFKVYTWCTQTRHGHRPEALRAFQQHIASRTGNLNQEDLIQLALVNETQNKPADAVAAMTKRFNKIPSPMSMYHLLMLADQAGDEKAIATAVQKFPNLKATDSPKYDFCKEYVKAFQSPTATLDLNAVDAVIAKSKDEGEKIEFRMMTARYLLKRNKTAPATNYIKQCYTDYHNYCADNLLLYESTIKLGLDPMVLGDAVPVTTK